MSIRSEGPIDLGGSKLTTVGDPTATDDAATKNYVDGVVAGLGPGGDIITGDTGQNAMLVAGNRKEVTFSTTTVQAVASTDVSNYRYVSVQITGQGTSSNVLFEGSNNNSTWSTVSLASTNVVGAPTPANNATTTGGWSGLCPFRYFRLNVTGISAGTTAGVVEFFSLPASPPDSGVVSISGTPNVAVTNTPTVDTELPAAAALADATANPTTTGAASYALVWNGTTWDRRKTATAATGTTGTGLMGAGVLGFDGTNYQRIKTDTTGVVSVDTELPAAAALADSAANPTAPTVGAGNLLWNGASWDRIRNIQQIQGLSNPVGLPATCMVGFDGTTYTRVALVASTGGVATALPNPAALSDTIANPTSPMVGAAGMVFNGTTWERARTANIVAGTTGTGVPAAGKLVFDGTNWQRSKGDTDGTAAVVQRSGTSAVTSVAGSATVVTLLAANAARKAATVYNDSTAAMYLKLGAAATTSSFTVLVAAAGYYELPQPCYSGQITALWASAAGNARITELS